MAQTFAGDGSILKVFVPQYWCYNFLCITNYKMVVKSDTTIYLAVSPYDHFCGITATPVMQYGAYSLTGM